MCSNNAGSVTLNFSQNKKGQDRVCVKINGPVRIDSTCFLGDPVTREQVRVCHFTLHVPSVDLACMLCMQQWQIMQCRTIVHIYKDNVYFNEISQAAWFECSFGCFSYPEDTKSEKGQSSCIRKTSSYTLASGHL